MAMKDTKDTPSPLACQPQQYVNSMYVYHAYSYPLAQFLIIFPMMIVRKTWTTTRYDTDGQS